MDEYLVYKELIKKTEEKQFKLAQEQEGNYNNLMEWGIKHFTVERRKWIIENAKKSQLPEWIINDLQVCHEEWQDGKVNHLIVDRFAQYDVHINKYQAEAFKDSKISKLHRMIFGGEEE
ncbi:TPA: hypothetical protein QCR36_000905 [Bacillus cereus]|uniref:hypothetical protein n=1 Tax=Bacillus cereus group TaxID=86661 RepID=UPI000BF2A005|nr:hypothetical protein [Bacillus thuringiensis]MDA2070279.1 hypothetical protein [Bacillus cereus]PER31220.1 hypothetical protein CN490_11455 [Bacillus cereus]PFF69065.1 hypothetical protein CN334_06105 [Bacillus thuringiensis]PGL89499.1 hypothetical protein CN943_28770 [Bacillus thuringiensis]HDR4735381.1 hypothetical protein [Bacillus cereus]